MSKIYSFENNVAYIKENRNDDHWNRAYRFFFPQMFRIEEVSETDPRQKVGIDQIVYLEDGTQYNIDEKVDRKGYPRFPIEIWQAHNKGYPGWAVKEDQQTDYIVYLVEPSQNYYLIPYKELKDVYRENEQQWLNYAQNRLNGFIYGKAWNNTRDGEPWDTHNVCVPFKLLRKHIPTIQLWNPGEYE